jgi:NAD(P)-dependent dehydrogenase (short-subunit alcohol dehydrogenase family)
MVSCRSRTAGERVRAPACTYANGATIGKFIYRGSESLLTDQSNVRGVFLAIQAAAAHLSDGDRIITIGSIAAVRSGHPGSSVYSMTKAAVAVM